MYKLRFILYGVKNIVRGGRFIQKVIATRKIKLNIEIKARNKLLSVVELGKKEVAGVTMPKSLATPTFRNAKTLTTKKYGFGMGAYWNARKN